MNKIRNIILACILVSIISIALILGCSISEQTIKIDKAQISGGQVKHVEEDYQVVGQIYDYLKIPPGKYTITTVDEKLQISVRLELTEKLNYESISVYSNVILTPLNKTGAAISGLGEYFILDEKDTDKIEELFIGKVGYSTVVNFVWKEGGKDKRSRILKDTRSFEIRFDDVYVYDPIDQKALNLGNSSAEANESVANSSDVDWDSVLDSYEKYIDDYISLYKKAKNGDATALSKYASMLDNAQEIDDKLEDSNDELTPAQASRFIKLQTKLLQSIEP